jgi:drug/metabolite transporter (DMT)-like permease
VGSGRTTIRRLPPRLGALAAVVFWGLSFVATKAALREVTPITLIFTRFALGTALLLALLRARGEPIVPPHDMWRGLALMGFVGVFVHQLLQSFGLTLTSAVNSGWLIGLTPLWSAVLAAILLHERFGARKVAGLLLGFLGAALVVTHGRVDRGVLALPSTRGDLLMFASTLNWSVYTVIGHPLLKRLGAPRATAGSMFLGWAMLAPLFVWSRGWREYPHLGAAGWAAVLFLGLACSGLGYLFWYGALEKVEASQVAALLYLEPLVTLAAAVVLLGEPVRLLTMFGGALVLAGVLLVERT